MSANPPPSISAPIADFSHNLLYSGPVKIQIHPSTPCTDENAVKLDAIPKYHSCSLPAVNVTDATDQRRQESLKTLRNLLKTLDGQKVTLIGDTMLDRYHHGFANNLNSTAPVPVLKITHSEESPVLLLT